MMTVMYHWCSAATVESIPAADGGSLTTLSVVFLQHIAALTRYVSVEPLQNIN